MATLVILLLFPPQYIEASTESANQDAYSNNIDLPSALEDELFNDLPFEQRRQVLREEVEYGPRKNLTPLNPKKYNVLIR